tara:strand:- start:567 stop:1487 length:921 start_codon:yes stop_codon:yes gene_type:complete
MSEEQTKGNPEIGMQGDSIEDAAASAEVKQSGSGSDGFFEALENQVNGAIQDDTEVTQSQPSGSEQVTHTNNDLGSNNVDWENDSNPYKKRYADSSREAVRRAEEYKDLEPFVPVLNAMKEDSGLVEHVREYLVNGGQPAPSIQDQLGIDENFEFNQSEAMSNPESDSAKLMNAHVDGIVKQRVNTMIESEKERANQAQAKLQRKKEELEFKKRNNMTDEQFEGFLEKAKTHILTLDDVHVILNKDRVAANTAQSTKEDMLRQMKSVQNMPASASGANSQGGQKNPDDDIFDGILGLDGGVDNLFG